jgi:hypothetical protein
LPGIDEEDITTYFSVVVSDCPTAPSGYSYSPSGDATGTLLKYDKIRSRLCGTPALTWFLFYWQGITVTFTNTAPIVDDPATVFCVKVELLFNGLVVHTKTFEYTVSANDDGTGIAVENVSASVAVAVTGEFEDSASETRPTPIVTATTNPASAVQFGQTVTLTVEGEDDFELYYFQIIGIEPAMEDLLLPSVLTQEESQATFIIPIQYFLSSTLSITATYTWDVDGRRQLQDAGGVPPTGEGTVDVTLSLDTTSVEGMTAGSYKVTSVVGRCMAAAGAMAAVAVAVV